MSEAMSRRAFLRRSAVLATTSAGLSAGVAVAEGVRIRANERIGIGVIGCRNRGPTVAGFMHDVGRFDIVTVCDCDRAMIDKAMGRLAKKKLPKAPKIEQDFRRMLDDKDVQAVVIATPDHWHSLMTVMALDAGKHVYVEKPASYNIADGQAMVAAQKKHPKLVVAVGTQHRSGEHFREARDFIASGGLGKVAFCRGWMAQTRVVVPKVPDSDSPKGFDYDMWVGPAPMQPYNEAKVHYNWHYMRDYGTGETGNWGIHWLDSIRHLMNLDVPRAACAMGIKVVDDAKEWPDTVTTLYEYPDLTVMWELRSWTKLKLHGKSTGVEVSGDSGSVVIDRGGWEFFPNQGEPIRHKGSALPRAHAANFADCIAGTARPAASIKEGHKSAILCHLSNISTLIGRRVEFDAATETIKNDSPANQYLAREYRQPWRSVG